MSVHPTKKQGSIFPLGEGPGLFVKQESKLLSLQPNASTGAVEISQHVKVLLNNMAPEYKSQKGEGQNQCHKVIP